MSPVGPASVVIVGATSAIAVATARLWALRGTRRFHLIGRDESRLQAVADDLVARGDGVTATVSAVDLVDPTAISAEVGRASALEPEVVLIAHGNMHDQAAMQRDLALASDQLLVAGVSPVLWLEAFVDALSRGTVAIIGSVAGDRGRRKNYLYGSTKAMIERAAQGMQHRLAGSEVHVVLIKPGPTKTPMTASVAGGRLASPADVASVMASGVDKRSPVVYAPPLWRLIMLVVRTIPRAIFDKLDF